MHFVFVRDYNDFKAGDRVPLSANWRRLFRDGTIRRYTHVDLTSEGAEHERAEEGIPPVDAAGSSPIGAVSVGDNGGSNDAVHAGNGGNDGASEPLAEAKPKRGRPPKQ